MLSPEWQTKKKNDIIKFLNSLFHAFDHRLEYVNTDIKKRSADGRKELKEKNLYSITELYVVLDWFMNEFENFQEFMSLDLTMQKLIFKSAIQEFLLIGWKGLSPEDKTPWCDKWSHGADCGRNVDHSVKKTAALHEWLDLNFSRLVENHVNARRKNTTHKNRVSFRL